VNRRVEPCGDEIDAAVIGGDLQYDLRVVAHERSQLRREDRPCCQSRTEQSHATDRLCLQSRERRQRAADVGKRGSQMREQLLAGIRRRHAARGAREQPHADLLLQTSDGVAHPRR
jgi:hypothetical protein